MKNMITIKEIKLDIVEEQELKAQVEALRASEPIVYTTRTLTDREIKDEDIMLDSKNFSL